MIDQPEDVTVKIKHLFALSSLAACLALPTSILAATSFSPDQVKQIKDIVHDYLVSNPQVLVEASEALQKQEMTKVQKNAKTAISDNAHAIFSDNDSPILGNPKGTVTVVEFFDYQCPHCKDMDPIIDKIIASNPNVRVIYKELPIFGNNSQFASQAALAAMKQGSDKFNKLHDALMKAQNPLTSEKVLELAKSAGLNVEQLKTDMNSDAVKRELDNNFKLAQTLGIMGTPTFIVSKWQVGAKNNNVSQSVFIPGATSEDALNKAIKQQS